MRHVHLTRDEKRAIPFILPEVLVTALLILYPLFYIISMSSNTNAMGKGGSTGLTNYIRLFKNSLFSQTIFNTMKWTFWTVATSSLIRRTFVMMTNYKGIMAKRFFRSLTFIAWIIPGVVKATAWKWPFATDGGMANHLLLSLGAIKEAIPWLTNPRYAMMSVIIVQIRACAPCVTLMMTTDISQLPTNLYESANLDGVSWLQKLFYITMPLLKDISFICIPMLLVWTIDEFSLIWIMTSGGQNTGTFSLLVYNQFKVLNLNSTSADAVIQPLITMVLAILYVKFVIKED